MGWVIWDWDWMVADRGGVDTASKGAVLAMTRELAMVHAREGIRVNSICPCVLPLFYPFSFPQY